MSKGIGMDIPIHFVEGMSEDTAVMISPMPFRTNYPITSKEAMKEYAEYLVKNNRAVVYKYKEK